MAPNTNIFLPAMPPASVKKPHRRAFLLRPRGLEPATCGLGNRTTPGVTDSIADTYGDRQGELGVLLGALAAEIAPDAPDLSAVLSAWASLPDAMKAGIVAMVKAAAIDGKGD